MEIKIPKTFLGKPVEGAMERALQKQQEKTEQERSLDSLQELIDRITNLETMIKSGKCGLVSIPIKAIILICLVIGVLCILSTILKS
jgi:ABC-type antimicrobial peptide transport system permease subunit